MRTPVFELHILPMFRATDNEHMKPIGVDLLTYDKVVDRREEILARLKSDMPPVSSGGLWPEEWIELFQRWATGARKCLELGTAQYAFNAGGLATITANGTFPAAGYNGWLQLESATTGAQNYVLYFEAPDAPTAGSAGAFTIRERLKLADTAQSVSVRDATGTHRLH